MSEYTFFVVATDGGEDVVRSSSAKVTVLVTDANDHTPGKTRPVENAFRFRRSTVIVR